MRLRTGYLRIIGLVILALLLLRLDVGQMVAAFATTSWPLLLLAVLLNIPQVAIRVLRWKQMLRVQQISYALLPATLAYFGSIFIGLLTPGRLGEFVKALYVSRDCNVSIGQAFSSVLVDRLFDLYMLVVVGGLALASIGLAHTVHQWLLFGLLVIMLVAPLIVLVSDRGFTRLIHLARRLVRKKTPALTKLGATVGDLRAGLRTLTPLTLLLGIMLTMLVYAVFFSQCYLTALAMGLHVGIVPISYAVALGSLITLLPISISGLGTREAAIIAYLGTVGVTAEQALGFSLLVFATFYIGGGLMGAVAWWIKPAPLQSVDPQEQT
jgi:hypothetical protein